MSLQIVHYNESVLHRKGVKIEKFDAALARLAEEMIEAMHDAGFRGHRLAYASTWFLTDTPGMLTIALGLGDPLSSATTWSLTWRA